MLHNCGPQEWFFQENSNIDKTQFRFKDKEGAQSTVETVVEAMRFYAMEEVLSADYLTTEWRPDLIENLMADLVPEKCCFFVVSQQLQEICGETEYWYGIKYGTESIPDDTIEVGKNKKTVLFRAVVKLQSLL